MKLFTYATRNPRATEQTVTTVSDRAVVHPFRLLNDKLQVKLLGTAFFRSEKGDKSITAFGKDAAQPLKDCDPALLCTQIQYWINDEWQALKA